VEAITDAGGVAVANYDSVASAQGGRNIIETAIDNFGRIDILINNAGNVRDKSFAKMDLENFTALLDVHLMGAVYCTRAAWPIMLEQQFGRVIMTSSSSGLFGAHGHTNYASAKLALVGFMHALIQEGTSKNVLVNSIAPMALTRMTEQVVSPKFASTMQPEFVSAMIAFLCSDECGLSGEIVECGMGYYSKVQISEGAGIFLGDGEVPTPDDIQDNWAAISDMSDAKTYRHAGQVSRAVFRKMRDEGLVPEE
ncbi:MAG: SDR family NAD(P)-dependent oxidoreductase, partial [bacterium]